MTIATAEASVVTTIQDLFRDMSELSGEGMQKLAEYAKWLREEQEIAELRVRFGTTPNAETIAAIEELRAGKGERVTIEQIMAELNA
jgi:hypothetical protein